MQSRLSRRLVRAWGLLGARFGGLLGVGALGGGSQLGLGWAGGGVGGENQVCVDSRGSSRAANYYLGAAPGGLLEDPTPPGWCSQHEWAVLDGARAPYLQ